MMFKDVLFILKPPNIKKCVAVFFFQNKKHIFKHHDQRFDYFSSFQSRLYVLQRRWDVLHSGLRLRRRSTASHTRYPEVRRSWGANWVAAGRRASPRPALEDTGLLQLSAAPTPATDGRTSFRTSAFWPAPVRHHYRYCTKFRRGLWRLMCHLANTNKDNRHWD